MRFQRPHSSEILQRIVPPLTIWALTQLLTTDGVSRVVDRLDEKIEKKAKRAERSILRARRNAVSSPVLLVFGTVAIVAGIGLLSKAALSRK